MDRRDAPTFGGTRYRWLPAALGALVVAGLVIGSVGRAATLLAPAPSPTAGHPVAGEPVGTVISTGDGVATQVPSPTASPTPSPSPSPSPTATPQPQPAAASGFRAAIAACRSLSGSRCNGRLESVRRGGSFWILVTFAGSRRGDTISARLIGPAERTLASFTVKGGDGYGWAQVSASGLPAGRYALVAYRDGQRAASTELRLR